MRVIETSLVDVLRERASVQPDETAFTFIDSNGTGTALPKAWRGHIFIGEQTDLARARTARDDGHLRAACVEQYRHGRFARIDAEAGIIRLKGRK